MDNRFFLDNLWRWKCGVPELEPNTPMKADDLAETEWSPEFEQLMRNRLMFGAYRYGRMGHGRIPPGKPRYDRCASIRARLARFERTGNAEWLVDIANMALLMFEERVHPDFNFMHVDGDADEAYHDNIMEINGINIQTKDTINEYTSNKPIFWDPSKTIERDKQ